MLEQTGHCSDETGGHCGFGQPVLLHERLQQGAPGHQEWRGSVRDHLRGGRGPALPGRAVLPATYNDIEVYVDPISLVVRKSGVVTVCNDVAPPRYLIGGKWFCAYPALRDCGSPDEIPLEPIKVGDIPTLGQGLGQSIYSRTQMESFAKFADSQGTRKVFLAESAHLNFANRRDGQWGLSLTDVATEAIVDAVGFSLIPLYRFLGPVAATVIMVLFLVSLVKTILDVIIRTYFLYRAKGPGLWLFTALWAVPFQVAISPLRWAANAADKVTSRVTKEMERTVNKEVARRQAGGGHDVEEGLGVSLNASSQAYPALSGWPQYDPATRPCLWTDSTTDHSSVPVDRNAI